MPELHDIPKPVRMTDSQIDFVVREFEMLLKYAQEQGVGVEDVDVKLNIKLPTPVKWVTVSFKA